MALSPVCTHVVCDGRVDRQCRLRATVNEFDDWVEPLEIYPVCTFHFGLDVRRQLVNRFGRLL